VESRDGPAKGLDKIDLNILETLQEDGRITNQDLAKRVFLSPSACLARVRQLEAAGLIAGYHARVEIERIKPTTIIYAEVFMNKHQAADLQRLDAALDKTPEVIEAFRVSGPFDYILKIAVSDMREWRDILERMLNEHYGVERVTSHVVMVDVKQFKGFPVRPRKPVTGLTSF
jgi:DNA-binding Lrp family transcriptional regulator